MSTLRQGLLEQLSRFDEDAFVALSNRGLYRRAVKDLEKQAAAVIEEGADVLVVSVAEHRVSFDARGPAHARCSCPASGVCQHIVAAALGLQRLGVGGANPELGAEGLHGEPGVAPGEDPLARLGDELLAIPAEALQNHAGRAGYRWAWQFVADLEPEQALRIGGSAHLVLGFQRPRLNLRYMGGGIGNLLPDIELAQLEKYRVAAVLAFRRAHGQDLPPPEPAARERSAALDLGQDHAVPPNGAGTLQDSRARLRERVSRLLGECLELGLAHLSRGIHERFSTMAVWAQGAEYHRLALALRRIADHVEQLLERVGGADEHRLLDELTLCYGLVSALDAAAARGAAPSQLLGRARSSYEPVGSLVLHGLGAWAWRSGSGYVGLTMLFWSAREQRFLACTEARPQSQRGFNARARYKAAGPWSGMWAPAQLTGRVLTLLHAQLNSSGRLSAADSTVVAVMPEQAQADFAAGLQAINRWSVLRQRRCEHRRSLLAEPAPMEDWVVLKPERFGAPYFDAPRQLLVWPLLDGEGARLDAELAFSEFADHAIGRIEAMNESPPAPGTLLVARLRQSMDRLRVEPLSLVRVDGPVAPEGGLPVDALHFDAAPGARDRVAGVPRPGGAAAGAEAPELQGELLPEVLRRFRSALQGAAERGLADQQRALWQSALKSWVASASQAGFSAFDRMAMETATLAEATLRANYLCLQLERLLVGEGASQD
ncbi:SWIM zinc finger family protein [Pelomonas sp. BJYL3]|uniref:SWIM zinc finger family protein n=1 Tax=Pelomonas sp. BJYL3 TaxID=2976697 RepID=UPI0022B364AF|nr:SWIM zinc finger family protein [Pelomonas sp. BJYL3]